MKKHKYLEDIISICKDKHLTADDIFFKLKEKYPEVGIATVYRNVDFLNKEWRLNKIVGPYKKEYFESTDKDHGHIIDKKTWKIEDINVEDLNLNSLMSKFKDRKINVKIYID